MIRRRDFITVLGGAAAAWPLAAGWPLAARAQQPERVRRIGVLMSVAANDPEGQARLAAFLHGLQQWGWIDGRNVRIDTRWGAGSTEEIRKHVAELVALTPDVILASGGSAAGPLLQATRILPIVFTQTPDPVGAGYVESLAHPGGNATGFTLSEYGISAKLLEVLKQIAPNVTRLSFATPPYSKESACGALSRQRHHHSGSRSALSTRASTASSNAPSQHSRASPMAA